MYEKNYDSLTLQGLLSQHKVEVPRIQRDYAQGRKDPRSDRIRERILNDIKSSLKEDKALSLAFVYGETRGESFYPLDGQQRLTTLWLVYWYVCFKAYEKDPDCEAILEFFSSTLANFSYMTRDSSTSFCEKMCKSENIKDLKNALNERKDAQDKEPVANLSELYLSELILSRTWFLSSWLHDPTIDAMLRTLSGDDDNRKNCIETIFESLDFAECKSKLLNESSYKDLNLISFKILELKTGSTNIDSDDIYIKMNSRGKPLSDFENFKSDLVYRINSSEELKTKSKFVTQMIDNDWTDFFWEEIKEYNEISKGTDYDSKNIRPAKMNFDPIFFSFINRFVLNIICLSKYYDETTKTYKYYPASYFRADAEESDIKVSFEKVYGARLKDGKAPDDSRVTYEKFDYYKEYLNNDTLSWLNNVFVALKNKDILNLIKEEWKLINKNLSFIPSADYVETDQKMQVNSTVLDERIYFSATCRFFLDNQYNESESNLEDLKVKYKRWMRVVHNLTRNCVFDDVTKMVDCLRDINDLAIDIKKSGLDTYNYLKEDMESPKDPLSDSSTKMNRNNDSENKMKYAGQLLEEAEKAARILSLLDEGTREEDITNSLREKENHAFFNGTIRFLYRDGNGDPCWDNFSAKFEKAKIYFPEKEGEDENKVPVATMQAFLSLFNGFDEILEKTRDENKPDQFIFLEKGETLRDNYWKKNILCEDTFKEKVHDLLSKDLFDPEKLQESIDKQTDDSFKAFIQDEKLLKYIMRQNKGKYIIESPESGDTYLLRVKGSNKPVYSIYLGKTRWEICKKLIDLNEKRIIEIIKGDDTCPMEIYDASKYLRGKKILIKKDEVEYGLVVNDDKQHLQLGGESFELVLNEKFEPCVIVGNASSPELKSLEDFFNKPKE